MLKHKVCRYNFDPTGGIHGNHHIAMGITDHALIRKTKHLGYGRAGNIGIKDTDACASTRKFGSENAGDQGLPHTPLTRNHTDHMRYV
jgi:hypothetical protein